MAQEINKRLDARVTKFYQDVSLGQFTDEGVRMRATELLAELLARRKADLDVHVDAISVIPAPRPQEPQPDDS